MVRIRPWRFMRRSSIAPIFVLPSSTPSMSTMLPSENVILNNVCLAFEIKSLCDEVKRVGLG